MDLKNSALQKYNESTKWENIFVKHIFDQEFFSRIYKELLQFNNNINNPIKMNKKFK